MKVLRDFLSFPYMSPFEAKGESYESFWAELESVTTLIALRILFDLES